VHEEEINVAGVVNEESLVAGGHHVACLLVGSETNLTYHQRLSWLCPKVIMSPELYLPWYPSEAIIPLGSLHPTYRWHNHLTLKSSTDAIIDTLWLSPWCVNTLIGVALMSVKALRAYNSKYQPSFDRIWYRSYHLRSWKVRIRWVDVDIRFLTMGMCFFAETICEDISNLIEGLESVWLRISHFVVGFVVRLSMNLGKVRSLDFRYSGVWFATSAR